MHREQMRKMYLRSEMYMSRYPWVPFPAGQLYGSSYGSSIQGVGTPPELARANAKRETCHLVFG